MRKTQLLAAIVIALGTATPLAAPASADDQLDQAFLKGPLGPRPGPFDMLTKKTKWSVQTSTDFGGLAVYAYRRDKLPAGAGP
jgi:hypothetical protein